MPITARSFILSGFTWLTILLLATTKIAFSQNCTPDFTLDPVKENNRIEWDKFPEFSLPFDIIYNGPRFGDNESRPLRHGFSHLASFSGPEASSLPPKNRALLWYSVGSIDGSDQPWSVVGLESPWGNDTALYRRHWDRYIDELANTFDDSRGSGVPRADIICLDIERVQELDRDILPLKRDDRVPAKYRAMSDDEFLRVYKRDIKWWYAEAVRYLRSKGVSVNTKMTSYSDVPVRGTWLNIPSNSWPDWTTNPQRTHFLMQDETGKIGGQFYDQLNTLTPSAYYYYPYENPIGKDYLTYLLFQIEANQAWSKKDQVPFVWMRYHDSFSPGAPLIPKFIAEATAIFPFFSGAKGLWLWENNSFDKTRQENYAPYEYFINGLYRLSRFADMFRGEHELVIAQSARDLMVQRSPVWRGVVKDGKILIAAQNPNANDSQPTQLTVGYKEWSKTITLTGKEIFLCQFDLTEVISALEPSLADAVIYPNPTTQSVFIDLTSQSAQSEIVFELIDLKGAHLRTATQAASVGEHRYQFDLPNVPAGTYLIKVSSENKAVTKRILIK